MNILEAVVLILFFLCLITGFTAIGMTYYLGKTKMKDVDRLVYGFEMPNDSIFSQIIRLPSYSGAFLWEWSAKRSKLETIRNDFDEDFQRPFKIVFLLYVITFVAILLGITIIELYLE